MLLGRAVSPHLLVRRRPALMPATSTPCARLSHPWPTPPRRSLKAWRDDIRQEVADWGDHIKTASDVGAKLSAALFNKETENIRQQMARAPKLAPACTILLNSCPSQTRLFTDDARITKAMEAADKHRPFGPKSSYRSGRDLNSRGAGMVTSKYAPAHKTTPYRKHKAAKSPIKKSGNPKGRPHHKRRGGHPARV
jgi:hypothetical protein